MSLPIKLLTVSNFFDTHRGGLEIVAGRLARELARRDIEVTWLASNVAPPGEAEGVRLASFRVWNVAERRLGVPWPILSPLALLRLWRAVGAADVVLLHDSLYMTSVATFLATRVRRRPLLVVQHIGHIPYANPLLRGLMAGANRLIAAPILRRAEQVVFISEFVREYFSKLRFRARPLLIFNGVDTDVFRPASEAERADARAVFGFAAEPVALFVGRFVEKKGVHLIRRLAERRPDITFAFAGWGLVDPERWGLSNVRVFSDLSGARLADLYRASDVFVLPSRGEGFPLVVQEALACGLPVVCGAESTRADLEAAPLLRGVDLTRSGEAAITDQLSQAIDEGLAARTPSDTLRRRRFVEARYAWSAAADRYAAILNGLALAAPLRKAA